MTEEQTKAFWVLYNAAQNPMTDLATLRLGLIDILDELNRTQVSLDTKKVLNE